jgi:hypothetical protein
MTPGGGRSLADPAELHDWQETARSCRRSCDKGLPGGRVCDGLRVRASHPILHIGADEIQYAGDHKYLTLVYQIEKLCTRRLWIGRERTVESFEPFFTRDRPRRRPRRSLSRARTCGRAILRVIRERCAQALHSSGVSVDHGMLDKALRRNSLNEVSTAKKACQLGISRSLKWRPRRIHSCRGNFQAFVAISRFDEHDKLGRAGKPKAWSTQNRAAALETGCRP